MKKKVIIAILVIIMMLANVNINKVEAYTGEIDPENYITLPYSITIKDKVGTGTISLSSQVSDYTISYEKIDTTKQVIDNLQAKSKEASEYISEESTKLEEKEKEVKALQEEYSKVLEETPEDETKVNEAKEKYETAYNEYNEYYENIKTEYEKIYNEYLDMIPTYKGNWKQTTNGSNNVQLDFSNATGKVYFILWVKITNGTNTYYDVEGYSSEIKTETSTGSGSSGNENKTDDENNNSTKAQFTLKKDGTNKAIVEVTGITPKKDSNYYLVITQNSDEPNIEKNDENKISLSYDEESKILRTNDGEKVSNYVELNQDLYASLIESGYPEDNILQYGVKLDRFAEPKYSDAFYSTFMSYDDDQIVTNFTHSSENNRKLKIKIGKITDTAILRKIKDQDSSGFADLLSYAKSNSGIFDQTLDSISSGNYNISYDTNSDTSKVIKLNGLEDGAYYYLYVQSDGENGKFTSNEAVTLAQSSVYANGAWYMFFYGSSGFKWADFGNAGESGSDETVAPSQKLPQTGAYSCVAFIVGAIAVVGAISYRNYKKNTF